MRDDWSEARDAFAEEATPAAGHGAGCLVGLFWALVLATVLVVAMSGRY